MAENADSVVADLGNITESRREGLRKLLEHGRVRVGMGMWDATLAVVSPAAESWLVKKGLAVPLEPHLIGVTELAERAGRELWREADNPASEDLCESEPTVDEWWPPSREGDDLVSGIGLGIAHHHATLHPGGGAGDDGYECFECPFGVEDGKVVGGGWVRFKAPAEP